MYNPADVHVYKRRPSERATHIVPTLVSHAFTLNMLHNYLSSNKFVKTCLSWHEQCDHFLSYLHMKMLLEAVDIVWILSTGTVRLRQCSPQKDLCQTDLVMMMLMIIYNNQLYGWYIINNICQILKKKKVLAFGTFNGSSDSRDPGGHLQQIYSFNSIAINTYSNPHLRLNISVPIIRTATSKLFVCSSLGFLAAVCSWGVGINYCQQVIT